MAWLPVNVLFWTVRLPPTATLMAPPNPSPMKASPLVTTPPSPPMARLPANVLPVTEAVDPAL